MMSDPVPNLFPSHLPGELRLALVGEAPGAEEVISGQPFVGSAGRLLTKVLLSVGLTRSELFIGNVCQIRPPGNDLASFSWDGPEIQGGIRALAEDLFVFRPNLIVALGNVPLHLFMAGNVPPKLAKGGFVFPFKISHWRGSLFLSTPFSSNGGVESSDTHGNGGQIPQAWTGADSRTALDIPNRTQSCVLNSPSRWSSAQPVATSLSVTCSTSGSSTPQPPAAPSPSLAPIPHPPVCHHVPGDNGPGIGGSSTGCGDPLTLPPMKTLATWHPAGVLRELSKAFELRQDLRKAVDQGRSPVLSLPPLNLRYGP